MAQALDALELSPRQAMLRRARRHKGLLIGSAIMLAMALVAVLAPLLAPYDPNFQNLAQRLMPPAWDAGGHLSHLLGTDNLGRDYLSRILYGARVSLTIGVGASLIGAVIGVGLGVSAGFFGGRVDQAITYLLTCRLALPGLLLIMSLVFLIGPSVTSVICVIGMLHWTYYLVVTRAETLRIRQLDFVAAARALGSSRLQIMLHEIVPNLFNQIAVVFTLEMGLAILSEAALSFLGVGVPPPTPSWGSMIAEGRNAMFFRPWLVVLPGLALFVVVVAVNLLGDGVRDVTAPESRN